MKIDWTKLVLAAGVATYFFIPIDLIPDIIPIIGFIDDLILGILLGFGMLK